MKENCKTAWKMEMMRQKMAKITPAEQKDASQKAEKSQQEAANRKLLFVRRHKTRSSFYVPSLMTNVYPTEDELNARKKEEAAKAKEKKKVAENAQEKNETSASKSKRKIDGNSNVPPTKKIRQKEMPITLMSKK